MSIVNSSNPNGLIDKPAYLSDLPKDDTSDMRQFMSPPRLKLIQKQTSAPFKPPFVDGDAIIIPSLVKIGDQQTEFTFVPLHFFPSWICANPYQMKATLKYIREQSLDTNSEVAKKARAFVKEDCPENREFKIKYLQVLNFIVGIMDGENLTDQIAVQFMSGEYNSGRILINLIEARNSPRYVCQFNAIVKERKGKLGDWFGLDIRNAPQPWLPETLVPQFRMEHEKLRKLVDEGKIQIDMEDSDMEQGGDAANETKY